MLIVWILTHYERASVKWTSQKLSKRRQKTNIFSELPLTANNEYSRKCDNMTLWPANRSTFHWSTRPERPDQSGLAEFPVLSRGPFFILPSCPGPSYLSLMYLFIPFLNIFIPISPVFAKNIIIYEETTQIPNEFLKKIILISKPGLPKCPGKN